MSHQRTVYLVEDDPDDRRALAFMLGTIGIEAWPFASGAAFVAQLGHLNPECVLLSADVPPAGGIDVMSELVRRRIDWPVIVLSGRTEVPLAVRVMKLGAIDFLLKPVDVDALSTALTLASTLLERSVREGEMRNSAQLRIKSLSPREVDITLELLSGLANKSVAHHLGISVRTVEMHRANIMTKLGVKSLAEAALIATQAGMELCQARGAPGVPILEATG